MAGDCTLIEVPSYSSLPQIVNNKGASSDDASDDKVTLQEDIYVEHMDSIDCKKREDESLEPDV